jgi:hypothetical protein
MTLATKTLKKPLQLKTGRITWALVKVDHGEEEFVGVVLRIPPRVGHQLDTFFRIRFRITALDKHYGRNIHRKVFMIFMNETHKYIF